MRNVTIRLSDAAFVRRTIHRLRDLDDNLSVHIAPADGDGVELRASFGPHVAESAIRQAVADCEGVTDFTVDAGSRAARVVRETWAAYR